jgi:uncharacterized membrane protein YcfT
MTVKNYAERIDWVDIAKGICIILVVMFHATLGVEKTIGETTSLNAFVEWARPFRMPDFFLISGLFLAQRIDRPWRNYLDTKVVHFAYFYLLWVHILLAFKAPVIVAESGVSGLVETYLWSYLDPFSSLWFIYLLAVYFAVAKLFKPVPKAAVLAAGALLHILWPHTGNFLADEFANRFVFFYAGYALSPFVLKFASDVGRMAPAAPLGALSMWAVLNAAAVASGWSVTPVADLAVSFAGILAVVTVSVLLARSGRAGVIQYCGRNSIAIYLAFTLFMGPARAVLLKVLPALPGEAVALCSTAAGILGALLLDHMVRGTRANFLFSRPNSMKLPQLEARIAGLLSRKTLAKPAT